MISCGWCGQSTPDAERCVLCRHEDPARPWVQRGLPVPRTDSHEGRPALDPSDVARRIAAARLLIERSGHPATIEALAEVLDVSTRTVRRWQRMAS